jgi:hypothetical protein
VEIYTVPSDFGINFGFTIKYYTMKQLLLIVLLGFGSLSPFTCSKNKTASEEIPKESSIKQAQPKQMALYGPVIKVVAQPAKV